MIRWVRRPGVALVAVALLAGGGVAAARATVPAAAPPAPPGPARAATHAAVRAAVAVCPDPVGTSTATTQVVATSAAALDQGGGSGSLVLSDLAAASAAGRVRGRAEQRGHGVGVGVKQTLPPLVASAAGALAPGLAATQTTRADAGDLRGLSSVACAAPATTSWFVGSGAAVGRRGRLYLTNPGTAPARVDVRLWGSSGPVTAPAGDGVTVAPGARRELALDALAPGVADLAVRVLAREGRVAAALRDTQVDGLDALGADWVPLAAPPARHVVVPGVSGGDGTRVLHLVVPGSADAIVKLSLVTPDGTFAPEGKDVLEARAGAVTDVDLGAALQGDSAAVVLDSDTPVTASLIARRRQQGSALADFSWTAATAPVGDAAVLPDAVTAASRYADLVLSAPGRAATVRLSPVTAFARRLPARTVTVPAGTTLRVPLAALTDAPSYAVVLEPLAGSGPVHAACSVSVLTTGGPLITVEPLAPVTRTVAVPSVRADLTTGSAPG